jgi:hypothetical protein
MLRRVCRGEHCVQAIASCREYGWVLWLQLPQALSVLYRFESMSANRDQPCAIGKRPAPSDPIPPREVLRQHGGFGHGVLHDRRNGGRLVH